MNDALRVLGKMVCQTSPVELYRSIRFVGDADGVMAMATDGVEAVSVILDAFAETSTPMKVASAVANVPTVTVAKSGGEYGTDDVRWKVREPG